MKLSVQAISSTTSRCSMRLQGQVGKYTVLILIDSGSSSNFISQQLADRLQYPVTDLPTAKVHVAGGGSIDCTKLLPDVQWYTQGHKFTTDLKVLPLGSYDIILGMDWLESQNNGKMWVNWKKKTMRFKHEGTRITLRGVQTNLEVCTIVSVKGVFGSRPASSNPSIQLPKTDSSVLGGAGNVRESSSKSWRSRPHQIPPNLLLPPSFSHLLTSKLSAPSKSIPVC